MDTPKIRHVIEQVLTKEYHIAPAIITIDNQLRLQLVWDVDTVGFVCSSTNQSTVPFILGCAFGSFSVYKYFLKNEWNIGTILPPQPSTFSALDRATDEAYHANKRHILSLVINYGNITHVPSTLYSRVTLLPVAVTKILQSMSFPLDPYEILHENDSGFLVKFNSIHVRYLLYVRASYAKIVYPNHNYTETLTLDSLALLLPQDFVKGTLSHRHQKTISRVLTKFAHRSDASRVFGMHLHIEPIGESLFPDPTLVLYWIRANHPFSIDPLTLKVRIHKPPFWSILLHVLPGTDQELDSCFLVCEELRELHKLLDQYVSSFSSKHHSFLYECIGYGTFTNKME